MMYLLIGKRKIPSVYNQFASGENYYCLRNNIPTPQNIVMNGLLLNNNLLVKCSFLHVPSMCRSAKFPILFLRTRHSVIWCLHASDENSLVINSFTDVLLYFCSTPVVNYNYYLSFHPQLV